MSGGHRKSSYCVDHQWVGQADCSHCPIRNLMLFSQLPQDSFDHLLRPIDNEHYPSGSLLCEQGASGRELFSIRRGLVKLTLLAPDGNERIVRLLGKGAVVGLELLDRQITYKHTAVAIQDVDLCRIPLVTMQDLEQRHPELCRNVRHQLLFHLDRADHWIRHLNTGKARTRVAELLLLLEEVAPDRNGDGGTIEHQAEGDHGKQGRGRGLEHVHAQPAADHQHHQPRHAAGQRPEHAARAL